MNDLNRSLAFADTLLSAISIGFMITGWRAIRQKRVRRHRFCMSLAFASSALFMALFVVRFVKFGFQPFVGDGAARVFYQVVFFAHEPIAVVSIPLVVVAIGLAAAKSFQAHREVARFALPIWLYAATTGVLLYFLLY